VVKVERAGVMHADLIRSTLPHLINRFGGGFMAVCENRRARVDG